LKINVCVIDESRVKRTMDKMGVDNGRKEGRKDGDPQVEIGGGGSSTTSWQA